MQGAQHAHGSLAAAFHCNGLVSVPLVVLARHRAARALLRHSCMLAPANRTLFHHPLRGGFPGSLVRPAPAHPTHASWTESRLTIQTRTCKSAPDPQADPRLRASDAARPHRCSERHKWRHGPDRRGDDVKQALGARGSATTDVPGRNRPTWGWSARCHVAVRGQRYPFCDERFPF